MTEQNHKDFEQNLYEALSNNGWKQLDVGHSRGMNYNQNLILYKRTRDLSQVLVSTKDERIAISDEILKTSSQTEKSATKTDNYLVPEEAILPSNSPNSETIQNIESVGSFTPMGEPKARIYPDPITGTTVRLSRFENFQSLRALRSDEDSLVIGFDSEWYGDDIRKMLSWQFALIHGTKLVEYVFIKRDFEHAPASTNLWLELALARILDDLQSPTYQRIRISEAVQYQYISGINPATGAFIEMTTNSWEEANNNGLYAYVYGAPSNILVSSIESDISAYSFSESDWSRYKRCLRNNSTDDIHITLVSHATKADITTLYQKGAYRKEILRYLTEAGGGLFSMRPIKMDVNSVYPNSAWNYFYPLTVHVRDSLCSAPAGECSLDALGNVVGVPKIELSDDQISHMDAVLTDTPALYMDYASRDAVITMLYTSAVYGINKCQAVTILAAGTKVLKNTMAAYLGANDSREFERIYRGLQTVKHGTARHPQKAAFIEKKSLEPINDDACILQDNASKAFQGGYNSCSDIGYFDIETYDYDLQNAYPSAMCLVPDADWDHCILQRFEKNHILTKEDFIDSDGTVNPFMLMFAYVRFEFDHKTIFPCLPNNIEGNLVFTRTSDGNDGIYACGPELYLAVKLGAMVTVLNGYKVRRRYRGDGAESFSMKHAVKQLVADRREAKELCGKGSIEELILKLIVNGGYGKTAQNVKQKNHWSAYTGEMEDIGCSSITNPVSAAMITSIVRAVLLAAQNQITAMGYTVYSVTTDGFISNIPEDVLKTLDLYGLRDKLAEARLFLTDGADPAIWEIKHVQNDLLNLTTRGNVSLNTGARPKELPGFLTTEIADLYYKNPVYKLPGVCAHNSSKSGYLSDSYDDRLWLTIQSLTRTGAVEYTDTEWTTFKELCAGVPFSVTPTVRHVRMDFDLKRKPLENSFVTVYPEINGVMYEIANFTTVAFENRSEYLKYRDVKALLSCLRTAEEWGNFFKKLSYHGSVSRPRNFEFSKILSTIIGYRNGLIKIDCLDMPDLTVADKCAIINYCNNSGKMFTPSDWKNARRPERLHSMLPAELLQPFIEILRNIPHDAIELLKSKRAEGRIPNWISNLPDRILSFFKRIWKRV